MSAAKGPGATSHCIDQTAGRTWQRSLLLGGEGGYHVWGIDVRLAHQLPGKPAAGAHPSQPLRLTTIMRAEVSL